MNCTIFLHPSMPPFIQFTPIVHYNGYSSPRNDKNIVCDLKNLVLSQERWMINKIIANPVILMSCCI